jgi:hypothetical protein
MYHDDGIYLVTAKALAEGHGYRIISLPGGPYETKYPIGYPFFLSALWRLFPLFPQNLAPIAALEAAIGFAALIMAILYLRQTRKVTTALALVIMTACAFNNHFLDFAPMLMSDMPYALVSFGTLWVVERIARKRQLPASVAGPARPEEPIASRADRGAISFFGVRLERQRSWLLIGGLMALSTLLRMQGFVLVLSCLAYLWCRRYRSGAVFSGLTAAILLLPQIAWNCAVGRSTPTYLSFYTNYVAHTYSTLPAPEELWQMVVYSFEWGQRVQVNTYFPFLSKIPYATLHPFAFELVYRVVYPLLLLPPLVGVLVAARKKSLPAIYLLLFALSLTIWPVNLEWRHLLVVLPIAYYFYFKGCRAIGRLLKPRSAILRLPYRYICTTVGLLFSTYISGAAAAEALLPASPALEVERTSIEADYRAAYSWIRENTPAAAVFISNNDPRFFLYTERKAVLPSSLELWRFTNLQLVDKSSLLAAIKLSQADYVIAEPTFRSGGLGTVQLNESIVGLSNESPGLLRTAFTSGGGLIRIFSIDKSKLPDR